MTAIDIASIVGGWAALLTSLMLFLGTMFGLYQLRIAAKARRLQVLESIYQQLRTRDVIEIEQDLLHDPEGSIVPEDLTDNEVRKINAVIYSYQRLGYFLYQGLITEQEVLPMVGWESLLLWEKLKGFIRTQVREDVPHARAHFEYLASRSSDFIKRNPQLVIPKIIGFDADMNHLRRIVLGQG